MNTLKMKIVGYDEPSHSLLVAYASDTTKSQDPADYAPVAIQINASTDIERAKLELARTGIQVALSQANKERLEEDSPKVEALKDLIGQEFSYAVSDIQYTANNYANEVEL